MECTNKFKRGRLILLWPVNVMIYGTCRLLQLLIKEQHGDQSLIRATVKGQRKVIKRLRDWAILTGNQSDFVHSTGNYLLCVRNHSLSTPSRPTWCLEALGHQFVTKWAWQLYADILCCLLLNLHGVLMELINTQSIVIALL